MAAAWRPAPATPMSGVACSYSQSAPAWADAATRIANSIEINTLKPNFFIAASFDLSCASSVLPPLMTKL